QLGFKIRVGAKGEAPNSMRLQLGRHQHRVYGSGGQSELGRQGAHAPTALVIGLLTNPRLYLVSGLGIMLGRPSRTGRIPQPLDAVDGKRLTPLTDRNRRNLERGSYLLVVRSVSGRQDNAAAKSQRLRCRGGMDQLVECATSLSGELDGKRDTGHCSTVPEVRYTIKNYLYDVLVGQNQTLVAVTATQPITPLFQLHQLYKINLADERIARAKAGMPVSETAGKVEKPITSCWSPNGNWPSPR